MRASATLLLAAGLLVADAQPVPGPAPAPGAGYPPSSGFGGATFSTSQGGHAQCVTGQVPISIASTNSKLLLGEPPNQNNVTELIQELAQVGSTLGLSVTGPQQAVSGTYNIDATLCFPGSVSTFKGTVQVLSHGVGLDKTYWDISPGYSYVDYAAQQGYATVAYNRLGTGKSDKPDPLQVVQSYAEVEILHGIAQLLRTNKLAQTAFSHVVAVGHSYGSVIQLGNNAKYPGDFDASVITGMSDTLQFLSGAILSTDPAIAAQNQPSTFAGLPNAYLVHDDSISISQAFFRYPYYDPNVLALVVKNKGLYTLGQVFTLPGVFAPAASYNKPVDVVLGQEDFVFCGGNCEATGDLAASTLATFFPARAAGSLSAQIPNTGHAINAHLSAGTAFSQIISFLKSNAL